LAVSDSGGGILAADIEKIFEPFYTAKVMGRSGTGLGLAVVWGTVKDHEGYIDVESEAGKGSTFTIYIPATPEALMGERPETAAEAYSGRGESILVVDGVKEQREVAKSMLTALGYRVHAVASGEEALAHLKDQAADLLVLDLIMDPGIDGLETYRRALVIRPGQQQAVIVSGFSEMERIRETRRLGSRTSPREVSNRQVAAVVDAEGTAFGFLGVMLHFGGGPRQLPEMREATNARSRHPDGEADEREEPRHPSAVHRLDSTFFPVLRVVDGRDNLVEGADDVAAGLLDEPRFHDEDEVIPPDVADEAAPRLSVLDNQPHDDSRVRLLKHGLLSASAIGIRLAAACAIASS
jgi:CheY-like chemotaxis protein